MTDLRGNEVEASQLQLYDEWLADHLEELVVQYAGKVVAIYKGEMVIVGSSEVEVYQRVRESGDGTVRWQGRIL